MGSSAEKALKEKETEIKGDQADVSYFVKPE